MILIVMLTWKEESLWKYTLDKELQATVEFQGRIKIEEMVFPREKLPQLVIQYQVISPEIIHI